jgi:hypothetical protein
MRERLEFILQASDVCFDMVGIAAFTLVGLVYISEQHNCEGLLLADFRLSVSASRLVKSDAYDWSSRMQVGGQVHAITQLG